MSARLGPRSHPDAPSRQGHLPGLRKIPDLYEKMRHDYGVIGVYLGQKSIDGEYRSGCSLICVVTKKKPQSRLKRGEKIPKRIHLADVGAEGSLRTDVRQKFGSPRVQALFNPGDQIRGQAVSGAPVAATVGAYATHSEIGPVFMTAGHFKRQVDGRRRIQIADRSTNPPMLIRAAIERAVEKSGTDYALLRPLDDDLRGSFRNAPVSAMYHPILRQDIGQSLYVLVRGNAVPTVCRGLYMHYRVPSTGEVWVNLIVTDAVTVGGDSGGALVDKHFRLWGLVIGTLGFKQLDGSIQRVSVYMPAFRLLALEPLNFG